MPFNPISSKNAAKYGGGGGMDPVTAAALISAATQIGAKYLPGGQGAGDVEKEGKANRKLERQMELIDLIKLAAKIEDQNRYDAKRAEFMAPYLSQYVENVNQTPKQTQLRNAAAGAHNAAQPGGGDPAVAGLVTRNFSQYQQERAKAKQMGAAITPESIYTPQTNPLEAVQEHAPEAYMDMKGMRKIENKPGDGLDDAEVAILNQKMAQGFSPQELSKMLATFRRKDVQGGQSTNG